MKVFFKLCCSQTDKSFKFFKLDRLEFNFYGKMLVVLGMRLPLKFYPKLLFSISKIKLENQTKFIFKNVSDKTIKVSNKGEVFPIESGKIFDINNLLVFKIFLEESGEKFLYFVQEFCISTDNQILDNFNSLVSLTSSNNTNPDFECNICQGFFNQVASIDSCSHQYCLFCIMQWKEIQPRKECPTCKRKFRKIRTVVDGDEIEH
jgi:hypothetical protein